MVMRKRAAGPCAGHPVRQARLQPKSGFLSPIFSHSDQHSSMSTLFTPDSATPPQPASREPPGRASLPFYGRSLVEYFTSFSLEPASLHRRVILDVGSGPSSLAVDAARRGMEVAAVDPLFGCTHDALATHVQLDYARVAGDACRRLRGKRLARHEMLEAERRAAAQRFLTDYESGFLHNRYIGGALPRLPFLDRSFDLVLCGHVLFGRYSPFDANALFECCCELVRVAACEARIASVERISPDGLQGLRLRLDTVGITASFAPTVSLTETPLPAGLMILRRAPK